MNKVFQKLDRLNDSITCSRAGKWIKPITKKLGVGQFLNCIKEKTQNKEEIAQRCESYKEFYTQHEDMFKKIPELLEDEFSRYTLERVVEFRKTWDMSILKDVTIDSEYFQKDIFGPVEDEVFIDGGAYIGDTVQRFIKDFAGGGTNAFMHGSQIKLMLNS